MFTCIPKAFSKESSASIVITIPNHTYAILSMKPVSGKKKWVWLAWLVLNYFFRSILTKLGTTSKAIETFFFIYLLLWIWIHGFGPCPASYVYSTCSQCPRNALTVAENSCSQTYIRDSSFWRILSGCLQPLKH